jgi:serine/threonine-protein phosphatase 2B catalytic subunit
MTSHPASPSPGGDAGAPPPPDHLADRLEEVARGTSPASSVSPATPASPATPSSPSLPAAGWRGGGHRRQQSLGTTKTSPSNRRRSLEGTMALIKDVVEGQDGADGDWRKLADTLTDGGEKK